MGKSTRGNDNCSDCGEFLSMNTVLYSSEKPQDLSHLPAGQYELAVVNLWDTNLSQMLYAKKVIFKRHFFAAGSSI